MTYTKEKLPRNIYRVSTGKNKFMASYTHRGKTIYAGTHETILEAEIALEKSQEDIRKKARGFYPQPIMTLPQIDPHFPSLSTLWNPTCQHQQISLSQ